MDHILTKEEFRKHVAEHEMSILHEVGLYRNIRFQRPDTLNMYFDIVTWPGYLLITGDMGSYLFSRLTDMFQFFRGNQGRINPGYWAEKLQAVDKQSGYKEWSREKFKQEISGEFYQWIEENDYLGDEVLADARARFNEEIIDRLDICTKDEAYMDVINFEVADFRLFQDFWEVDTEEYSYHYLWACYAIVWAIEIYYTKQPS